jgi:thiol-disulfide isomerase/thioredoxin
MVRTKIGFGLLAGLLLSSAGMSAPPPTVGQMLQFKPRHANINYATPTEAELANGKVELVKGQKLANGKNASGWALKDAQGRFVRRFFDSDGDNQIDVWSYFLNGDEVYREIDSNFNNKVDQYRWLGVNGSKWGIDLNEDGRIDSWRVISAEETSQEILAAVLTNDIARLQALMITKAEIDSLELPESEITRIKNIQAGAANKFQATNAALAKLNTKTRWVHLETGVPECTPADALGSKADLIRHRSGTILYSDGEKINDFLQTGEMILVGKAWRIVDAPVPGGVVNNNAQVNMGGGNAIPDEIKDLIDELKKVDDKYKDARMPAQMTEYNIARAAVLEKIVAKLKGKEREDWIKQIADCYSSAAQNGDRASLQKLTQAKNNIIAAEPGSILAGYLAFRELSADYALKLNDGVKPEQMARFQEDFKDRLTKFVQDYPTAEDAPDALMQLGMLHEFLGKEPEAKNWYAQLVKNFEKNPMAPKAQGAIRRLGLDGQEFDLVSLTLSTKKDFDVKSLKGKIVIVYYWASWNSQCIADFAKLKATMATYAGKGVELIAVNLDNAEAEAIKFLQTTAVPGIHLHQPGGLESPPAVNYGIMVLPNTFLVGADGKVINRNAQIATLDDDLKKLVK